MSVDRTNRIGQTASEAGVDIVWRQWQCLGAPIAGSSVRLPSSVIDPEALVLASLGLWERERRLLDVVAWWARTGSRMLSVQRMRTLLPGFGTDVEEGFGVFAALADRGGDRRWRRYATKVPADTRGEKGNAHGHFEAGPTIILRLRAGFGVSAKADVMSFLLGRQSEPATARQIAAALDYTPASIRAAVGEMVRAGVVERVSARPAGYRADNPGVWAKVLRLYDPNQPPNASALTFEPSSWRYWSDVFAFLLAVTEWSKKVEQREWSPFLAASAARDLFEQHRAAFTMNAIPVPPPNRYRGAAYLEGFETTVTTLAAWVGNHV